MLFMAVVCCSTGLALGAESRGWGPAAVITRVTRIVWALLARLAKARAAAETRSTTKVWCSAEAGAPRLFSTTWLALR